MAQYQNGVEPFFLPNFANFYYFQPNLGGHMGGHEIREIYVNLSISLIPYY